MSTGWAVTQDKARKSATSSAVLGGHRRESRNTANNLVAFVLTSPRHSRVQGDGIRIWRGWRAVLNRTSANQNASSEICHSAGEGIFAILTGSNLFCQRSGFLATFSSSTFCDRDQKGSRSHNLKRRVPGEAGQNTSQDNFPTQNSHLS